MKKKIAIICGGKSFEHNFSIVSANNIIKNIDKTKYKPYVICINYNGNWHLGDKDDIYNADSNMKVYFDFDTPIVNIHKNGVVIDSNYREILKLDIVFPITNGVDGHQGALPGMFKLLNIPCVGNEMFETVICVDKEVTKALLENSNIKTIPYLVIREANDYEYKEIIQKIGQPFFLKPCRLGSSAGVNRVNSEEQFKKALIEAKKFDDKFLLEKQSNGREIECAVIGNSYPIVAPRLGEVISDDFYTYEAKYISKTQAQVIHCAKLKKEEEDKIYNIALKAYKVLGCKGFARVDFFLEKKGDVYVNEVGTIPLFTDISMFPKLWDDKKELIQNLINYAFEKVDE